MRLTPSDAARLFGIHRATLYRHMAAGRLSWVLEPNGSRALDMSELIRCYGEPPGNATPVATSATPYVSGSATEQLLAELVELTRKQGEELRKLREEVSELRRLPAPKERTMPASRDKMQSTTTTEDADPHGLRALVNALRS